MALEDVKRFNIGRASVSLWVFRQYTREKLPVYTGHWIEPTDELSGVLKEVVSDELARITETMDYGILTQNNENSALSIPIDETHARLVIEQAANQIPGSQVGNVRDLANAAFYVIKLSLDDDILYAVRKTDGSWKTKKAASLISVFFQEGKLDLDNSTGFNVSKSVDFFIHGTEVLIADKQHFESLLAYKEGHIEAFTALQAEPEFSSIFDDMKEIVAYVGDNKIQLRRASAIHQKAHYKNPEFMNNLRKFHKDMKLNLSFDAKGRLIPKPENCKDIFIALLDHRLTSRTSENLYTVPSTEDVPA